MFFFIKKHQWLFLILIAIVFCYLIFKIFHFFTPNLPILRVMTYSSFAGDFGPGSILSREFKKQCGCKIRWVTISDSTLFLQRLNLREDHFKVDLVMGFDQLALKDMQNLKWKTISSINGSQIIDPVMTFISRKPVKKTLELPSLLDPIYFKQITLPKPQLSTVGLQFVYWLYVALGEKHLSSFLEKLGEQLYGQPPSWSTSYSLFQRGHTELSFSFFSSLLYHKKRKQTDFYALQFKEGHPYQIEFLSIPKTSTKATLAKEFIHFMLSSKAQMILKEAHFMFPVIVEEKEFLPPTLSLISYEKLNEFHKQKKHLLSLWSDLVKL